MCVLAGVHEHVVEYGIGVAQAKTQRFVTQHGAIIENAAVPRLDYSRSDSQAPAYFSSTLISASSPIPSNILPPGIVAPPSGDGVGHPTMFLRLS